MKKLTDSKSNATLLGHKVKVKWSMHSFFRYTILHFFFWINMLFIWTQTFLIIINFFLSDCMRKSMTKNYFLYNFSNYNLTNGWIQKRKLLLGSTCFMLSLMCVLMTVKLLEVVLFSTIDYTWCLAGVAPWPYYFVSCCIISCPTNMLCNLHHRSQGGHTFVGQTSD